MVDRLATALNILWVAPAAPGQPPLEWLAELGAIQELSGAKVTPIIGPAATVLGISNALSLQGIDITIWSGHGRADGLLTSDGTILSGLWIATQIRSRMPKAFVIGACSSGEDTEFVKSIVRQVSEAGVNCIGYLTSVDDKAAAVYAVEFVRAMLAGAEINVANDVATAEATKISKGIRANILFMPGISASMAPVMASMQRMLDIVDRVDSRMAALEVNVVRLMAQMELLPTDFRTALREIKK